MTTGPLEPFTPLRRILFYTRPYLWIAGLSILCVFATNGFAFTIPWMIKRAIDLMRVPEANNLVPTYAWLIIIAAIGQGLTRWASRVAIFDFNRSVERDLRCGLFAHLQRMHPGFLQEMPPGDILSRATNDLNQVRMAIGMGLMLAFNTLTAYIGSITMMFVVNWRLALWAILPYPVLIVLIRSFGRLMHTRYVAAQASLARISTQLQENYAGHHLVQAYAREEHEIAAFGGLNEDYVDKNMAAVRMWGMIYPIMASMGGIGSLIVLWMGGHYVIQGVMTLGDFVAFNSYLAMLIWPTMALGWVLSLIQRGSSGMQRIEELFQKQPAIGDGVRGPAIGDGVRGPASGVREITGDGGGIVKGKKVQTNFAHKPIHRPGAAAVPKIEFRNFTFSYGPIGLGYDSEEPSAHQSPSPDAGRRTPDAVLQAINLLIDPGETIAIMGLIGAGKSTLVQALPRLIVLDPDHVFLDDIDITQLPLSTLRSLIAFVPQDPFLFTKTLAENIAYGADAARGGGSVVGDRESEEILHCSRIAHLDEDVQQFPQGYNTPIGERGITLSGGQRQRATIARALFTRAPILVLDDAFASVDTATEWHILQDLRRERLGRTTLMVTHRVATAQQADRIVILEGGRITHTGTHEALLGQGGLYARLFQQQQLAAEVASI